MNRSSTSCGRSGSSTRLRAHRHQFAGTPAAGVTPAAKPWWEVRSGAARAGDRAIDQWVGQVAAAWLWKTTTRHVQVNEDEVFHILEGNFRFRMGSEERRGQAGDTVLAPIRRPPHVSGGVEQRAMAHRTSSPDVPDTPSRRSPHGQSGQCTAPQNDGRRNWRCLGKRS